MSKVKRIGVLTGGGDAPGLNPAIKGVVYRASERGIETVGLSDGWLSLLNPPFDVVALDRGSVRRWDRDGGTNLGSSRTNPFKTPNDLGERIDKSAEVIANVKKLGLDAIVACGGEETPRAAPRRSRIGGAVVCVSPNLLQECAG